MLRPPPARSWTSTPRCAISPGRLIANRAVESTVPVATSLPNVSKTARRTSRNWTSCSDDPIARAAVGSSCCSLVNSAVNAPSASARNVPARWVRARSSTKTDAPANATSGSPRTSVYHSVRRARRESGQRMRRSAGRAARRGRRRWVRGGRGDHVPHAATGGDEGDAFAAIDLAAQSAHVDVDQVRERVVVVIPDVGVDLGAGDDAAGVADEVLEECVLLGRERDLALPAAGRV